MLYVKEKFNIKNILKYSCSSIAIIKNVLYKLLIYKTKFNYYEIRGISLKGGIMKKIGLALIVLAISLYIKSDVEYTLELSNNILAVNGSYKIQLKIPVAGDKKYTFDVQNNQITNLTGEHIKLLDGKIIINASKMCTKRRLKQAGAITGGVIAATGAIAGTALAVKQISALVSSQATSKQASTLAQLGISGLSPEQTLSGLSALTPLEKAAEEAVLQAEALVSQPLVSVGTKAATKGATAAGIAKAAGAATGISTVGAAGAGIGTAFGFRNATAQISAHEGPYKNNSAKINYDECDSNKFVLDSNSKTIVITKE